MIFKALETDLNPIELDIFHVFKYFLVRWDKTI